MLLVPGGVGTRLDDTIKPVIDFVRRIYQSVGYVVTVCTKSGVIAKAEILDGGEGHYE